MRHGVGITIIMALLALGSLYNLYIGMLTLYEYHGSEIFTSAGTGASLKFALASFALLLIYGLYRRRGWALFFSIVFMCFGLLDSVWTLYMQILLGYPYTIAIIAIALFSLGIYYLSRRSVREEFYQ
ncbi:MAG: hypothetical protein NZ888_00575 [Candidatus Nitrosocaldus sp.]|nr:hypothetical protein [Candidatus Nitrosocaldus sp.]MCS7140664.1 hypothetical protein [Candidatus Nitrosocaldus sp.]MDW7999521.1 hypothetical protein [Candidatus Nitrosocaldus sp.]